MNEEKKKEETREPFYRGDGMHSVYELEKICRQYKEYCYQQQLTKQSELKQARTEAYSNTEADGTEIKDYLFKNNKELPYWEDEVISIVTDILNDRNTEIVDKIEEMIKTHKHISENLENVYENKKLIEDRRLYWIGKIEALTELLEELEK